MSLIDVIEEFGGKITGIVLFILILLFVFHIIDLDAFLNKVINTVLPLEITILSLLGKVGVVILVIFLIYERFR